MAYKFIKTIDENNKHDIAEIQFTVPSNDVTSTELIELFEDFLKACSFGIYKLEIVQEPETAE